MKTTKTVTQEIVTTIELTEQDVERLIVEALQLKSHDNAYVNFDIRQGDGFLAGATVIIKDVVTFTD